jgi:hypothetical protein
MNSLDDRLLDNQSELSMPIKNNELKTLSTPTSAQ